MSASSMRQRIEDKLYSSLLNSNSFLKPDKSEYSSCLTELGLRDESHSIGIYQNAEPYTNIAIVFFHDKLIVVDSADCPHKNIEFTYKSIEEIDSPISKKEWADNSLAIVTIRLATGDFVSIPVATSNHKITGPDIGNFMSFLIGARLICRATIYNKD
jgi:hypothetical protein